MVPFSPFCNKQSLRLKAKSYGATSLRLKYVALPQKKKRSNIVSFSL